MNDMQLLQQVKLERLNLCAHEVGRYKHKLIIVWEQY